MSNVSEVAAESPPKKLAIIMPAYNAGRTIESVFERIPAELNERITDYLVVNDGSTDDTAEALTRIAAKYPNMTLIDHGTNRGYGAAEKSLLDGFLKTTADVAVLVHSDGQYAPEVVPKLVEPFDRDEADVVQGSRMLEPGGALRGGMPLYKYVANRGLTAVENLVLGMRMAEYHSGMMLYSRRAAEAIPFHKLVDSFCFDQTMLIMAKVKGLRIVQLPIPTHYGDEVSHLRPIRYGLATLSLLWAYVRGHYHSL